MTLPSIDPRDIPPMPKVKPPGFVISSNGEWPEPAEPTIDYSERPLSMLEACQSLQAAVVGVKVKVAAAALAACGLSHSIERIQSAEEVLSVRKNRCDISVLNVR